ncbi:MAG: hypothetical protein RIR70_327 [Pseudomonadota bacterium]|jgi:hypothetical protein
MFRFLLVLSVLVFPSAHAFACGSGKVEKFDKFFNRFVKDAQFAKNRTRYPLAVTMVEPKGQGITEASVSKEEDLYSASLGDFMQANGLGFAGVKLSKGAATVNVFRDNPPWQMGYRFTQEAGCWYLIEIEDRAD